MIKEIDTKLQIETAETLKSASENHRKLIAHRKGCSVDYLERQWLPGYRNWLMKKVEWIRSYEVSKQGYEIVRNFIDLEFAEGWKRINGFTSPLPNEQEREFWLAYRRMQGVMA